MNSRRPYPVLFVLALLCASCSHDEAGAHFSFRWHRRIPPARVAVAAEWIRASIAAACANSTVKDPEDVVAQLETTALQLFGQVELEAQSMEGEWPRGDPVAVSLLPLSVQGAAAVWVSGPGQRWLAENDPIPGLELQNVTPEGRVK